MITVELKDGAKPLEAEAAICFDDEGLEVLIGLLIGLRGKKEHEHLMTPSWSGSELSEVKRGGEDYQIVNHLRLVKI